MEEYNQKKKIVQYSVTGIAVCVLGFGYLTSRGMLPRHGEPEPGREAVVFQTQQSDSEEMTESVGTESVFVYVCGAVVQPGVYELAADSRICAAIEAAGGFSEDADELAVNLAGKITDGSQIYIPKEGDPAAAAYPDVGRDADGRINLNTADKAQLMTLPGIGETRAEAILEYRKKAGAFSCIEDIMKVSGIKNALYEQICEFIKV